MPDRKNNLITKILFICTSVVFLLLLSNTVLHAMELHEADRDFSGIADSDHVIFQQVMSAGAHVLVSPERKPFLVYWVPDVFERQSQRRVLVVMHGTNGNA